LFLFGSKRGCEKQNARVDRGRFERVRLPW
jgi:hypothetical protein